MKLFVLCTRKNYFQTSFYCEYPTRTNDDEIKEGEITKTSHQYDAGIQIKGALNSFYFETSFESSSSFRLKKHFISVDYNIFFLLQVLRMLKIISVERANPEFKVILLENERVLIRKTKRK